MNIATWIAVLALALILFIVIRYLVKEKRKGSKCIGCHSCAMACPFGVPRFGRDGVMRKCDAFYARTRFGYVPACVDVCPTGALRRTPEDSARCGVTHQPTFCVQCGTCEAICPQGAITVSPETNLADFLRGRKVLLSMKRPDWEPNQYDSIFKKMIGLLGSQNNLATY